MGLAVVARVVERHGGRIWADASPGLGATFWFNLKLDAAHVRLALPQPVVKAVAPPGQTGLFDT